MASSFTLNSASYQGRYLQLYCTQTTDIGGNYSTITWTLSSIGGSSNYYSVGPTTVTINGSDVYSKSRVKADAKTFPAAKGSTSGTTTVYHDTTGYASISVSLSTAIFTSAVSTVSDTWTLDSIPRGAYLTSAPQFTDEDNPTISYFNPAGNSVDVLQACIAHPSGSPIYASYRDISKTDSSYTFYLTAEERQALREATANSKTLDVNFVVYTGIGSNPFWSVITKTLTITNAVPTLNPVIKDANVTTVALTGNDNVLIKGYSWPSFWQNGAALKSATITGQNTRNGNQVKSGESGTFATTETNIFGFWIQDSRGNQDYIEREVSMIDYVPLTCNIETVNVETSGSITFRIKGNYFNGSFGAQNNSLTLAYWYTKDDGTYTEETYITPTFNGNTYSIDITLSDLDYKSLYTIKARASDKLAQINATDKQIKIEPVFDWGKEDFNFNVPVTINNNPIIYPVEEGTSGNWHYKKWSNGELDCWGDIPISFSTAVAWGYGYISSNNNSTASVDVSLPSGMFATIEAPVVTIYRGGILFTAMGNYYDTSKISLYIWAPTGPYYDVQATASIRVKGTWNIN